MCSHSFKRLLDPLDSRRAQNEALDHVLYKRLPKCSVCSKLTSYVTNVAQENAFYLQDLYINQRLPRWLSGKESTCQCRRCKKLRFDPWDAKILWSRKWQPTPVFLSEKSYAQRSLVGYSPGGGKELDTTVQLSIHQRGYIKAIVSGGWQGQFYTFPITLIVHRRQEC